VRAKLLTGLKRCNVYCIVYYFFTELIFGVTLKGEKMRLTWLNVLLTHTTPDPSITQPIIRMVLGGETGLNPSIQALLDLHGYIIQPTGVGAVSRNGAGERPHRTIGNAVWAMLHIAGLPPKYLEYAFYFFLCIHKVF
jgi:hypothetical protein